MVGDKTLIAIGIGCRRGTPAAAIEALIRQALAQAPASALMPPAVRIDRRQIRLGPALPGDPGRLCPEPAATRALARPDEPGDGDEGESVSTAVGVISQPTRSIPALFSIRDKAHEPGLIEAARRLGLDVTFLARDALRAQTPHLQTRSRRVEALFGVPSIAEAAALVGAGANAQLIVPRIASQGVTCAIAREGVTCKPARGGTRTIAATT